MIIPGLASQVTQLDWIISSMLAKKLRKRHVFYFFCYFLANCPTNFIPNFAIKDIYEYQPQYIIIMTKEEPLSVIMDVVYNTNSSNKVHNFSGTGVKQIISALMTSVAIYPFQPELWGWCSLVTHCYTQSCSSWVCTGARTSLNFENSHSNCPLLHLHHGNHSTNLSRDLELNQSKNGQAFAALLTFKMAAPSVRLPVKFLTGMKKLIVDGIFCFANPKVTAF